MTLSITRKTLSGKQLDHNWYWYRLQKYLQSNTSKNLYGVCTIIHSDVHQFITCSLYFFLEPSSTISRDQIRTSFDWTSRTTKKLQRLGCICFYFFFISVICGVVLASSRITSCKNTDIGITFFFVVIKGSFLLHPILAFCWRLIYCLPTAL